MAVIMTLSLAACGTQETSQNISEKTNDSAAVADSVQDITANQDDEISGTEEAGGIGDKVLIVYFSHPGTETDRGFVLDNVHAFHLIEITNGNGCSFHLLHRYIDPNAATPLICKRYYTGGACGFP